MMYDPVHLPCYTYSSETYLKVDGVSSVFLFVCLCMVGSSSVTLVAMYLAGALLLIYACLERPLFTLCV